jgi:hypothetical protein
MRTAEAAKEGILLKTLGKRGRFMKKFVFGAIAVLSILTLIGCGGGDHHDVVVVTPPLTVVNILSDPTLDGDITLDGSLGPPTVAANTGNVLAGVDVSPVPIFETRGFLIFPLSSIPVNASIWFASITVFVNNVSFVGNSSAPIPFLLDSIDTILFPPPLRSTDFDAPFRTTKSLSFFGGDAGTFVEIDVTSLLADAQAQGFLDFEVRFLFDQLRYQNDPATTRGFIEIDDRTTNTSQAPLLYVEYF